MTTLTTEQVWQEIERNLFAVLGMVTAKGEARTVGIVYAVQQHKLYIASDADAWKVRHIAQNPHVSLTIPIAKRIPFLPWIKIPAATITFTGTASIIPAKDATPEVLHAVLRHLADHEQLLAESSVIEVVPKGEFITYGIGMPLMQMRDTEKARGRVSV